MYVGINKALPTFEMGKALYNKAFMNAEGDGQ